MSNTHTQRGGELRTTSEVILDDAFASLASLVDGDAEERGALDALRTISSSTERGDSLRNALSLRWSSAIGDDIESLAAEAVRELRAEDGERSEGGLLEKAATADSAKTSESAESMGVVEEEVHTEGGLGGGGGGGGGGDTTTTSITTSTTTAAGANFLLRLDSTIPEVLVSWGRSELGQLLNASEQDGGVDKGEEKKESSTRSLFPDAVASPSVSAIRRPLATVSAGPMHSLAVSRAGAVFAAGDNAEGQLGLEGSGPHPAPQQIPALRGHTIVQAAAG